jgi:hypothetical protein
LGSIGSRLGSNKLGNSAISLAASA